MKKLSLTDIGALSKFVHFTQHIYTAYIFATAGMKTYAAQLKAGLAINPNSEINVSDKDPALFPPHAKLPTREVVAGLSDGGHYSVDIAHGQIVRIYTAWDEVYQSEIADELGLHNKNLVRCDLMGDVRHIRNLIVHNNSVADSRVENLAVLKWPNTVGKFAFNRQRLAELQKQINQVNIYTAPE